MQKILLILDIDETIVYSSKKKLDRKEDFRIGEFYTYKRPHLDNFLKYAFERFNVAIWTSSSERYADEIVNNVITDQKKLVFLWSREKCTKRYHPELMEDYWIKDLSKAKKKGYALERMLIIDDSPEKLTRNYGNHINVPSYTGSDSDGVLKSLMKYLDTFVSIENVRKVEKRGWLNQYYQ